MYRLARFIAALTFGAAAFAPVTHAAPKTALVLALPGEVDQGFDPIMGWGEYGHPLFQSTLLVRNAALVPQPDLATAWRLSEDRLTWTVTLRDGVRFSDGTALTAADVAFTFERASRAGGLADLTVLAGARAIDPSTVEFRLKEPRVTFFDAFLTLGIVPAASYADGYARKPIGSGPYRLVDWAQGQQLIVEANPYFHGKTPPFRKITFLFTNEDTTFAAAQAGQLDLAAVPAALAGRVPAGMTRRVVRSVDNRGLAFPMEKAGTRTTAEKWPVGNDVTADRAIRLAINTAIDRKALVAGVLNGFGSPAYGPADGLPWSDPQDRVADADPQAAMAILDGAGWKPGPDGVRVKDGRRAQFQILYFSFDSTRQALALAVADMLRPVGILAEPAGKSREEMKRLKHGQAALFGWGSHNPLEVYSLYSGRFAGVGFYNTGFYSNATVDGHFAKAQQAASLEASFPDWQRAQWDGTTGYGVRGDAAWAWLVNLDHIYFVDKCLDLGATQVEPHGHGWPITAGLLSWTWTCP